MRAKQKCCSSPPGRDLKTSVVSLFPDRRLQQEFTINGQAVDDPEDENDFTKAYRDKLLYATREFLVASVK